MKHIATFLESEDDCMAQPHLRIYYGPDKSTAASSSIETGSTADRVTVPISDIFPLLAEAVRSDRVWLQDFADDEITISSDLYDVLLAFQHYCRRPSA
jgi:hypothetical protein